MAYKITDDCVSCGACEAECKNEAISEGDAIYVIDPDKCTEYVAFNILEAHSYLLYSLKFLRPVGKKMFAHTLILRISNYFEYIDYIFTSIIWIDDILYPI